MTNNYDDPSGNNKDTTQPDAWEQTINTSGIPNRADSYAQPPAPPVVYNEPYNQPENSYLLNEPSSPQQLPYQQPGYAQQPYGYQNNPQPQPVYNNGYQQPYYVPNQMMLPTDSFAIASLVMIFVFPLLGIIFGSIALKRINSGQTRGKGLATTALIINIVYTIIGALLWLFVFGLTSSSYGGY